MLARALEHHRAGRLAEAATLYQEILADDPHHADALHLLGVIANQVGQHALAAETIGRAIAVQPNAAVFHVNLGEAHRQLGRFDEAIASLRRALVLDPRLSEAHNNLGIALQATGALDEAIVSFVQAVALQPGYAEAHNNLGNVQRAAGRLDMALESYDRALALRPDDPAVLTHRGRTLLALGRAADAAASFQRALTLNPNAVDAIVGLGDALQRLGALDDAIACYDTALQATPDDAGLHSNRGAALLARGRHAEATAGLQRAIALAPDDAGAHNNLGNALQGSGRLDDAVEHYERALALRPDFADAAANLGNALVLRGEIAAALVQFERALALRPDDADILNSRGRALVEQGRLDDARASFSAALARDPARAAIHSNLLFLANYDPALSEDALLAAHRAFGAQVAAAAPPPAPHANSRDPARRLRIGYVSADLARHPVGWFLRPVLANHAAAAVETVCYAGRAVEDDVTAQLRAAAGTWRSTVAVDDAALAAQIRADGIDILVDLAGHTAGNRLPVFARKPAPVQASWIGYFATTGVAAIDCALLDAATVPEGAERWFTEAVVRLPIGRLCYGAPAHAPAVAPPPAATRGHVTFVSFNNLTKVTPAVIALWARVLDAVHGAHLVLKWRSLADAAERARLHAGFAAHGIAPERLLLRGHSAHAQMLAEYGDVDIALDPFPFCGGLTSAEALWMGVPIVTLPGARPVSRQTLAFLTQIGLTELAARDDADYVAIAARLAGDPQSLAALRAGLRDRITASPLGDGARFARALEDAYRAMWQRWCAR